MIAAFSDGILWGTDERPHPDGGGAQVLRVAARVGGISIVATGVVGRAPPIEGRADDFYSRVRHMVLCELANVVIVRLAEKLYCPN